MRAMLLGLSFLSTVAVADGMPQGPYVSTTGVAEVKVMPDRANLNLSASVLHKDGLKAKHEVDERVEAFILAAQALGISQKDINAGTLYTRPEYNYPKHGKRELLGYRATRKITLTLDELDKLSKVLDSALESGLQEVTNIQFTLRDTKAAKLKARALAIKDSKDKAAQLAQAYDAKLGEVYSIKYQQADHRPVYRASVEMMEKGDGGGYIQNEIVITDQVNVTFDLQR